MNNLEKSSLSSSLFSELIIAIHRYRYILVTSRDAQLQGRYRRWIATNDSLAADDVAERTWTALLLLRKSGLAMESRGFCDEVEPADFRFRYARPFPTGSQETYYYFEKGVGNRPTFACHRLGHRGHLLHPIKRRNWRLLFGAWQNAHVSTGPTILLLFSFARRLLVPLFLFTSSSFRSSLLSPLSLIFRVRFWYSTG